MKECVLFIEPRGTVLEVVRAAKDRGYAVVALTSQPQLIHNAALPYRSAAKLIDEVISIASWEEQATVLEVVRAIQNRLVICGVYTGSDPCVVIASRIRQQIGLPTPSPEALALVLNKYRLRTKLRQIGLSELRSFHGSDVDMWKTWEINGAAYFKPLHGFFSVYVRRCDSMASLGNARLEWKSGVKNEPPFVRNYLESINEYHLEEAFDGELLSVEGISSGGQFTTLGLLSRILYSKNPIVEMGSCFPYPHPQAEKIVALVRDAHRELGITDGPTHTEVIVDATGKVEIIDLNPRFVGADVLQSINYAYGIKIQDALLAFALGLPVTITPRENSFSCIQYVLPPNVDQFESIQFPTFPEVKFTSSFLEPRAKIKSYGKQLDYLGCYLTVMPTFDDAIARSLELRKLVVVNGQHQGDY